MIYKNTYSLEKQLNKAYSSLKNVNNKELVEDNMMLIKASYNSVKNTLKCNRILPTDDLGNFRIFAYADEYLKISENKIDIKKLLNHLSSLSEKVLFTGDEISVIADFFKLALLINISQNMSESESEDSSKKINNAIDGLRKLNTFVFDDLYERLSKCESSLQKDELYRNLNKESKDIYRHKISQIAKKQKIDEIDVVNELLTKSSQIKSGKKSFIGYHLFSRSKIRNLYFPTVILICLLLSFLVLKLTGSVAVFIFSLLPFYYISRALTERIFSFSGSSYITRLDIKEVPKTLVTVTTLISDEKSVDSLCEKCLRHMHSNNEKGLMFGFLADLPASVSPITPQDNVVVEYAEKKIKELNLKHNNKFFFAVRAKKFDTGDGMYKSYERKRGAIEEFLQTIETGENDNFIKIYGDIAGAKYFAALDSDTRPDIDSVKELVSVLENPLYTPKLNTENTIVTDGYGIAVPRIETELDSSMENLFTKIFGGKAGTDTYSYPSFNVYNDIFGESIFAGKGVINIEFFNKTLRGILGNGSVLSHDIIEGGFLRTIYVSDVVFYDKTPKNLISFSERNDRWIRGDWQNIRFLCRRFRNSHNEFIKNPLSNLSKYKIFDNIFRSVLNVNLYILFFISAFSNNIYPAMISVIFLFWEFLSEFIGSIIRPYRFLPFKYRSGALTDIQRSFLYCFSKFILLPYSSFTELRAILKAIFRMFTRKKLLEWKTSDQADASNAKFTDHMKKLLWQLTSLLILFNLKLSPLVVLWILGIPYSYILSRKKLKSNHIHESDAVMKEMWGYFEDFLNEKNNYLPPDNYQEKPLGIYANRTSPTNIGLTMLTILGAYDMGFIDESRLYFLIDKIIASVESLETFKGHLLNWYDIGTKTALTPKYISTVDSGNFICSLYALKNGLGKFKTVASSNLAKRLDAFIKNTEMNFLYDENKQLFYIGYDCEKNEFSKSYYDIYASESRLTSFFSIATRQVPLKHWQSLNRPITMSNGYIGIKSWSGTAFEYLMPHLLLPLKKGSLSDEMIKFAINEQIKRTKNLDAFIDEEITDIPWGISESCYYTFGSDLAYQYKAFGVNKLAINKHSDQTNEVVISPYSTLMSLPYDQRNAIKNLNLLAEYESKGQYGYYEAIDFHKTSDFYMPKTVNSFMVHHIGMSFLSLINLKKDNIMQKRFMDSQMSSFEFLLDEKIPQYDPRNQIDEPVKILPKAGRYKNKSEEISEMNPYYPKSKAYSDGKTVLIATDGGESILKHKDIDITYYNKNDFCGTFALSRIGNSVIPFTFLPLCDDKFQHKTVFHDGFASYETKWKNYELNQNVTLIPDKECELREFTVKNNSNADIEAEIIIYFEPILQNIQNYSAHPAFSNLFIEAHYNDRNRILTFSRRNRNDGSAENKLDIFFDEDFEYDFELSKFNVLKTNKGKASLCEAFDLKFSNNADGPINACAAIRFKFPVNSKSENSFKMFLSFSNSVTENMIRNPELFSECSDDISYELMKTYKENNILNDDIKLYENILNIITAKKSLKNSASAYKNIFGIEELWKYGISGNNPTILIKTDEKSIENCRSFIGAYFLLKKHLIACDMIFAFTESVGYNRKILQALTSMISQYGLMSVIGKDDGIFLININDINEYALIHSVSEYVFDLKSGRKVHLENKRYRKQIIRDVNPIKQNYLYKTGIGGFTSKEFAIDDKRSFAHKPPWCNILANQNFGTLVSDSSLGFTYAENSYKNKLTPWNNDVTNDNDGEKLYLIFDKGNRKRVYDLIRNSSVLFGENFTEYYSEAENVTAKIKVFVPQYLNAKIIKIRLENSSLEDVRVKFEPKIIMNESFKKNTVNCTREQNTLIFTNEYNSEFKNGTVFLKGIGLRPDGEALVGSVSAETSEELTIVFGYGKSKKTALLLSQEFNLNKVQAEELKLDSINENDIKIHTPSQELDLIFNNFLKNQIIKCRIFAKTGFYQCSGAFGFRDQLQDSICISTIFPKFLKHQIMVNSAHQFVEGDVMHWFHKNKNINGKICGVRTKSSDDLLWLPFAICEYVEKTEDYMFLARKKPYITANKLGEHEDEKYVEADISSDVGTVYDHGKRAILKGLTKGEHGLLNFGSGDWNDGFNRLDGGETVWGTFFIIIVLERFAKLCKQIGDSEFAEFCEKNANEYRTAIQNFAWGGDRFIRGYFPSGNKIGDASCQECSIDIIAQSFASICGGFDSEKIKTSLETAEKYLVDSKKGIVKLFTPPFYHTKETPGYIMGYIPGVRENGGQYTHASIWYALALLKNGNAEKAFDILDMLNPINHSKTLEDVKRYRTEPYVLSADVYANPSHYGMGGWSWYTGSAGWYYKVIVEDFLGIKMQGNFLKISPVIPKNWHKFSAEIKKDGTTVSLTATRSAEPSYSGKLFVDNIETQRIPLDGKHHDAIYYL